MLSTLYKLFLLNAFFLLLGSAFGQGSQLPKYVVSQLPPANQYPSYIVEIVDGTTPTDCTVGGANNSSAWNVVCVSHGGSWVPAIGSSGGGGNTLAINSFQCASNFSCSYEIGQKVSSPSFSATYIGNPSAASVSDGINSAVLLSAPYNSFSVPYSYTFNTTSQVCFTLTTTPSASANTCMLWVPRQWSGLSQTGTATGNVSAVKNNVVLSTGEYLTDSGLASNPQGSVFGPFNSSQPFYIYILVQGCNHTDRGSFMSGGLNFPMTLTSQVTVNNQYGDGVGGYCLYRSTNQLGANSGAWNIVLVN